MLNVDLLALVLQILAPGRAFDGEPADRPVRHPVAMLVVDLRDVSRNGASGRSGANLVLRRTDEDVQHFGAADPVEDRDARLLVPLLPDGARQRLARGDARSQLERSNSRARAAIARYATGAVKTVVTPCVEIASSSSDGPAFSSKSVAAPAQTGKSSMPPSPNVNASGGLPQKRSLDCGCNTRVPYVSHVGQVAVIVHRRLGRTRSSPK